MDITPEIEKFVNLEWDDCTKHKIKCKLNSTVPLLDAGEGMKVQGWFDEDSLQVATGRPVEQWLPVFIHESCHKDQFLEKSPLWETKIKGYEATELLDQWLAHVCELNSSQLSHVIDLIKRVELDCEIRSLKKIRKHNLPIDMCNYARMANVYVLSYEALRHTRTWFPAVSDNKALQALVSQTILPYSSYDRVTKNFLETLKAEYAGQM